MSRPPPGSGPPYDFFSDDGNPNINPTGYNHHEPTLSSSYNPRRSGSYITNPSNFYHHNSSNSISNDQFTSTFVYTDAMFSSINPGNSDGNLNVDLTSSTSTIVGAGPSSSTYNPHSGTSNIPASNSTSGLKPPQLTRTSTAPMAMGALERLAGSSNKDTYANRAAKATGGALARFGKVIIGANLPATNQNSTNSGNISGSNNANNNTNVNNTNIHNPNLNYTFPAGTVNNALGGGGSFGVGPLPEGPQSSGRNSEPVSRDNSISGSLSTFGGAFHRSNSTAPATRPSLSRANSASYTVPRPASIRNLRVQETYELDFMEFFFFFF